MRSGVGGLQREHAREVALGGAPGAQARVAERAVQVRARVARVRADRRVKVGDGRLIAPLRDTLGALRGACSERSARAWRGSARIAALKSASAAS